MLFKKSTRKIFKTMKIDIKEEARLCLKNIEKKACKWGVCEYCGVPYLLWKIKTKEIHPNISRETILRQLS